MADGRDRRGECPSLAHLEGEQYMHSIRAGDETGLYIFAYEYADELWNSHHTFVDPEILAEAFVGVCDDFELHLKRRSKDSQYKHQRLTQMS
jgi:hypothetical protein